MSKVLSLLIITYILGIFAGITRPDNPLELGGVVEQCSAGESRSRFINCIYQNLGTISGNPTTAQLMSSLELISTSNPLFRENLSLCHDVSHAIGQHASKSGKQVGVALSQCSVICTAGCYHGVIEGHVSMTGEIDDELIHVCKREIFNQAQEYRACLHGLGHGIASILGVDVVSALKKCDELDESDRQHCGAGVLMELYEPGSFDHAKLEYPENILELCESFWGSYETICEQTAGAHEFARSRDYQSAINICDKVAETNKIGCATELGAHFYHASDWQDEDDQYRCKMFSGEYQQACFKGIVTASKNADPNYITAKELCNKFGNTMKDLCNE